MRVPEVQRGSSWLSVDGRGWPEAAAWLSEAKRGQAEPPPDSRRGGPWERGTAGGHGGNRETAR